jgi:hypothetical protein
VPFEQIGNETLSETYEFRLSQSDKAWIREQAKLCGMSMAEFVRRRALGMEIVPKADVAMMNRLNSLGGMLKKALNNITSKNGQIEIFKTMAAIREMREAIKRGHKKDQEPEQIGVESLAYRQTV